MAVLGGTPSIARWSSVGPLAAFGLQSDGFCNLAGGYRWPTLIPVPCSADDRQNSQQQHTEALSAGDLNP